jgi:outer membrane protein assembly factor BamB
MRLLSSYRVALCVLVIVAAGTLTSAEAKADAKSESYKVTATLKVGGEGSWDYATIDDSGAILFVTRSTHSIAVDTATGKTVADFGPSRRSHGVALVPEVGRGFITDGGAGTVIIFDLKTYAVLGAIAAADDADGIIYDPSSKHLFIACGDAGVLVPLAPDVDPMTGKADAPIALDGKPEFLAADGNGKVYVNIVDKNFVAAVDLKSRKVIGQWPTAPGTGPTGLSIDAKAGRLFVGCKNKKMIVMSTSDGSVLAALPIGTGVDATAFRDGVSMASCGDGTLTIIRETSPGKFEVAQTVATAVGAKTMAVDRRTGTIYLPTADMEPTANNKGRRAPVPGTFKLLVVAEQK